MQCPTERRGSEILGIKLSRKTRDGSRLVFFFLGDVRSRLRHVPSCRLSEAVPKVVERGQVARLDEDHAVVGCSPDMGILCYYGKLLGQCLLEPRPVGCRFLLIRFR